MTKDKIKYALNCLSPAVKSVLDNHYDFIKDKASEIHLRLNCPVSISTQNGNFYFSSGGGLLQSPSDKAVIITKPELSDTFNRICRYSVYNVQNELINGFVTVSGGHRAGVCGTAVISDGKIVNIRDISSVNLRLSREIIGCSNKLVSAINNLEKGVIICGEPCSGKTTVLRDLARYISIEENKSVSLIDERGELAASVCGENQNDVGLSDVFSGYPKPRAVEQALRCMSPSYIICDEIGADEDVKAIESCANCGVSVIAAIHASNEDELSKKPNAVKLLKTGAFETVVFLSSRKNAGRISKIIRSGDLRVS